MELKAKKASEWLSSGNRVKIELFLKGRTKYMDKKFLQERLERILRFIETPHRVVDGFKDSPKGITVTVEKTK
jgi:translation initiation factor IF-3